MKLGATEPGAAMAVSFKPVHPMGMRAWQKAHPWAVHRAPPSRRRSHRPKPEAIPGTAAAYIWLAVALGLSAAMLALALRLIAQWILGWMQR